MPWYREEVEQEADEEAPRSISYKILGTKERWIGDSHELGRIKSSPNIGELIVAVVVVYCRCGALLPGGGP